MVKFTNKHCQINVIIWNIIPCKAAPDKEYESCQLKLIKTNTDLCNL